MLIFFQFSLLFGKMDSTMYGSKPSGNCFYLPSNEQNTNGYYCRSLVFILGMSVASCCLVES